MQSYMQVFGTNEVFLIYLYKDFPCTSYGVEKLHVE